MCDLSRYCVGTQSPGGNCRNHEAAVSHANQDAPTESGAGFDLRTPDPRYLPVRPFAGGHMVCGRVYHPASLSLSPLWGLFCFALFLFCFQTVSTTASPCLRHPGLRVPSRSPLRPLALSAARGGALCPGEGCPGCHQLILMACLRPQASGNGGTQRELRVTNILGPVCTPQEVSLPLSLTSAEGRNSWNRDAGCKKVHNL